jgi:signal transduction histidine kinase
MPIELRFTDRQFNRLALTGVIAGFLLLVGALAAVLFSFRASQSSAQLVQHTYQVTDQLSELNLQLERAESGQRGYLLAEQPYRLRLYRDNSVLVPRTLARIGELVADNPRQVERLSEVRQLADAELEDLRRSIALAMSGAANESQRQFAAASENTLIRQIRSKTAEMRAAELRLLDRRGAGLDRSLASVQLFLVVTGILLIIAGGGTFWLMRSFTSSLARARDRLHLLNTDLEGEVQVRTADLQRANDEIQRFAYIVSHDLRSPLVNVMGFTAELEAANKAIGSLLDRAESEAPQLITPEAQYAREDLPEAIGFIRSSTQKMDRLINAILTLSRQGRRVLSPEHLDMRRVIDDIAKSLATQMDERSAALEVQGALPDLHHDRLAVEQIFQNLIENATKYLRPGVPGLIKVSGQRSGKRAIFEIEDNGRGIDPQDHERIFDLFRRSGAQDQRGEGIGLAHVRALAYRLGGTVTLRSQLNEGSTFIVDLPMTYATEGSDQ